MNDATAAIEKLIEETAKRLTEHVKDATDLHVVAVAAKELASAVLQIEQARSIDKDQNE